MKKLTQQGTIGALFAIVLLLVIGGAGYYVYTQYKTDDGIDTFEECKDAGYPIAESYPEQCNADGKNFVDTSQSLDQPN